MDCHRTEVSTIEKQSLLVYYLFKLDIILHGWQFPFPMLLLCLSLYLYIDSTDGSSSRSSLLICLDRPGWVREALIWSQSLLYH